MFDESFKNQIHEFVIGCCKKVESHATLIVSLGYFDQIVIGYREIVIREWA